MSTNDLDLLSFLKPDQTCLYIKTLFRNCYDVMAEDHIEIRKLGKILKPDGSFKMMRESVLANIISQFNTDNWQDGAANWVTGRLRISAEAGIGAFLAPAILKGDRAKDNSVKSLVSVCADFDQGDPESNINALSQRLGFRPSFVVRSGGITAEGKPKLHSHWILPEPCTEPWKVAYIREQIAKLYGADPSFKRIPQIIRIPGALYDKNGQWATTEIIEFNENVEPDMMEFEDALQIDWDNLDPGSLAASRAMIKTPEQRAERIKKLHDEKIYEGGTDNDTRWSRFNEYAGHQIRQARAKVFTTEEALQSVIIWVENNMIPAWEIQRINQEFSGLLNRDYTNHPEIWGEHNKPPIKLVSSTANITNTVSDSTQSLKDNTKLDDWSLINFDIATKYKGKAPPISYIIENFLIEKSTHALVADGGVGKTYLALELAARLAAGPDLDNNKFLGFDILKRALTIVFTAEDTKDDIHRRIEKIDPQEELRSAGAGYCFIVPTSDELLDGLILVERDDKGQFSASSAWKYLVDKIQECREKLNQPDIPVVVIIDTYSATHHGDENSSTGTNEWFRAANRLRTANATLLITHHTRKNNPNEQIKTSSDMRNAVRGSVAFVNNCRLVYGLWEMSNSLAKNLPKEQQDVRLFNLGMLKNNTGIDWSNRSEQRYKDPLITLRRAVSGQLVYDDLIHQARLDLANKYKEDIPQLKAAMIYACQWYAQNSWALTERQFVKDPKRFLPLKLSTMKPKIIRAALAEIILDGELVETKIKTRGGSFIVYDIPEGPYSLNIEKDRSTSTPVLDWNKYEYDANDNFYLEKDKVSQSN